MQKQGVTRRSRFLILTLNQLIGYDPFFEFWVMYAANLDFLS